MRRLRLSLIALPVLLLAAGCELTVDTEVYLHPDDWTVTVAVDADDTAAARLHARDLTVEAQRRRPFGNDHIEQALADGAAHGDPLAVALSLAVSQGQVQLASRPDGQEATVSGPLDLPAGGDDTVAAGLAALSGAAPDRDGQHAPLTVDLTDVGDGTVEATVHGLAGDTDGPTVDRQATVRVAGQLVAADGADRRGPDHAVWVQPAGPLQVQFRPDSPDGGGHADDPLDRPAAGSPAVGVLLAGIGALAAGAVWRHRRQTAPPG